MPLNFNTQLVHAGARRDAPTGRPNTPPIYTASTYSYDSMAEADEVFAGTRSDYIYARHGNPTTAALEEAICTIEAGATACTYASGMAALHAALFACDLQPGATVLASQDLYGATLQLLDKIFAPLGVKVALADFNDLDAVRAQIEAQQPRALLAETISNPLLKVCDLAAIAEIARGVGAKFIVDNTFATPYLCQPLQHGADFTVHSATKYLGGHGDAMGGLVVARDAADQAALQGVMKLAGGILGVWDAHQILRGIRTLALRVERQCANARTIAEFLAQYRAVQRVHFPAFPTTAAPSLVARYLRPPHAGALVTLELADDTRNAAFRFMDALQLCVRATSLGDVFTGVLHPATASHRELSPAQKQRVGIREGLVRISLGIEDAGDIIADLEQALAF